MMKLGQANAVIYREMLFDLYYRLQLADKKFCQVGDQWLSATTIGKIQERVKAIAEIRALARALRILSHDWQWVTGSKAIIFPAALEDCFLEESSIDEEVQMQLERLHAITKRMDLTVQEKLEELEAQNE